MSTKFTIAGQLTDLNTYVRAMNSSRWSGNDIKGTETQRVRWEALRAKIGPIKRYPVVIVCRWYVPDRRKDLDNVAFAKKFVCDGLVLAKVLEDDSQKFVQGFRDEFYVDKSNPRVEVEIESVV